jgi:hypothetical protein
MTMIRSRSAVPPTKSQLDSDGSVTLSATSFFPRTKSPVSRPRTSPPILNTILPTTRPKTSQNDRIASIFGERREEYSVKNILEKLIEKLPSEMKFNILELVDIIILSEKRVKSINNRQGTEIRKIQADHDIKNSELHTSLYAYEVMKQRLHEADEQNLALKDALDSKDRLVFS